MPLPLHSTGAAEAATVRATRATKLRDTDAVTEGVVEMEAEKEALLVNLPGPQQSQRSIHWLAWSQPGCP